MNPKKVIVFIFIFVDVNIDEFFNFIDDADEGKESVKDEADVNADLPADEKNSSVESELADFFDLDGGNSNSVKDDEEEDESEEDETVDNKKRSREEEDEEDEEDIVKRLKTIQDLNSELESLNLKHILDISPSGFASLTLELLSCTVILDVYRLDCYPDVSLQNIIVKAVDELKENLYSDLKSKTFKSVTEIVQFARAVVKDV
jgi:hypothetical protein